MVFVYSNVFPAFDDPNDENYCNKTLFLFAFSLIIILNITIALITLTVFGLCIYVGAIILVENLYNLDNV